MRSSAIFSLLSLLSVGIHAAVIDSHHKGADVRRDDDYSQTDGVWINGVKVGDLVTKRDISAVRGTQVSNNLAARNGYDGVGCDDFGLNPTFAHRAKDSLLGYCDKFPDACRTDSIWAKAGDTVAFFCQYRDGSIWNSDSFNHAIAMVEDQCADTHAGSYSDKVAPDTTYAYGWTNWKIHDWCGMPAGYEF